MVRPDYEECPFEDYPGDPPERLGLDRTALTTGIVLGLAAAALIVAVVARLP